MAKYLCRKLFKAKSAMNASAINFVGSIQNLLYQDLPTFTSTMSDDELQEINEIGKTLSKSKARPQFNSKINLSGTPVLKFELLSDSEFNQLKTRAKSKARPVFDLKINSSGTPVLKFRDLSADFNGPNKLNSQSCLSGKKISQKKNFHVKKA